MALEMRTGVQKLVKMLREDKELNDGQRHEILVDFQKTLQHTMMNSGPLDANTLFDCAATEAVIKVEMKILEDRYRSKK